MSCCSPEPRLWWSREAPRRTAPIESGPALTLRPTPGVPGIPPRPLGWLKHLHHKVGLDDDWSRSGTPDPSWDGYSTPPLLGYPRIDLIDSANALAVLADLTPAWRELYVEVLDGLLRRFVTWWGTVDWLTTRGRDPQRGAYPESWRGTYVPVELWGDYEAPGWMGDGIAPWGDQPDPIGADGNLYYKGWLSLMLGIRERISGEEHWERPFAVVPDADGGGWTYSHRDVNQTLEAQWGARPEGCHCENTKIWPICLSAAGLGLFVRDGNAGSKSHWVFDQWFAEAERRYLRHADDGTVAGSVLYHDPIADVTMPGLPPADLTLAFYLAAQRPDVASQVWTAQVDPIGWRQPDAPVAHIPDEPRFVALGRVLARELGDGAVSARLDAFAESLEPTWSDGAFFFGFGFDEQHPRGQPNATMILAEAIDRPGRWAEAALPVGDGRFDHPSVSGVDFPLLGLSQAAFDPDSKTLWVGTYAASATDGATTTFKVTGLHRADEWRVFEDARPYPRARVVDEDSLEVTCSVAEHHFAIRAEDASA